MKTNFKKSQNLDYSKYEGYDVVEETNNDLSQEEFEDYVEKSGARGSFMIYRTSKKEDELGIDNL